MSTPSLSTLDRWLARICVHCPVCRQARRQPHGLAFKLVSRVEARTCPFCRAYARVYGRPAHGAVPPGEGPAPDSPR